MGVEPTKDRLAALPGFEVRTLHRERCSSVGFDLGRLALALQVIRWSAEQVEAVRRFGWQVYYGDATRLDLLRSAGAETARLFVLAIDDVEQSVAVAKLVREHFPHLGIVARARNVSHYYQLRNLGIEAVERETLDSALMSGRSALERLGLERHQARTLALRFRRHNLELVEQMRPHTGDEAQLIAIAKQGRQQLEEQFAREREEARQHRRSS